MTISPEHRFTPDDVGRFFTTNGSDCWRLVGYQAQPSVIVENVETKERRVGAVDSLNVDGFVRLVREYEPSAPWRRRRRRRRTMSEWGRIVAYEKRRARCRRDQEPPMNFAANGRWLATELPQQGSPFAMTKQEADRIKCRAHAINAWMIIETIRVNRRIARDVKPAPIPPPGDLTNQLKAVTRRLLAKRDGL